MGKRARNPGRRFSKFLKSHRFVVATGAAFTFFLVVFQNCGPVQFAGELNVFRSQSKGYVWQSNGWSDCTVTCGGGDQFESFGCRGDDGSSVQDFFCPQPKPENYRTCNTQDCNAYSWGYGNWSSCSATPTWTAWTACSAQCGGGTQSHSCINTQGDETRNVYCKDLSDTIVADSLCDAGSKPADQRLCTADCIGPISQECNMQTCTSGYTYSWIPNGWTTCSASCGGGTQSQIYTCMRSDGTVASSESLCPVPKPSSSQTCNTQACATYDWYPGSWGSCNANPVWSSWSACSASCGGGTKTRSCLGNDGTQTRTVTCKDSSGNTVSSSLCNAGTKPPASQSCTGFGCVGSTTSTCNTQPCYTWSWVSIGWSSCSKTCGSGTKTELFQCVRSDGVVDLDSVCAQFSPKPNNTASCNTQPCLTYQWQTSSWAGCTANPTWGPFGQCSVSCGGGTQTRTCLNTTGAENRSVWCEASDGTHVADSLCTGTKPTTSQSCTGSCIGSNQQSCNEQDCVSYSCYCRNIGSTDMYCPTAGIQCNFPPAGLECKFAVTGGICVP